MTEISFKSVSYGSVPSGFRGILKSLKSSQFIISSSRGEDRGDNIFTALVSDKKTEEKIISEYRLDWMKGSPTFLYDFIWLLTVLDLSKIGCEIKKLNRLDKKQFDGYLERNVVLEKKYGGLKSSTGKRFYATMELITGQPYPYIIQNGESREYGTFLENRDASTTCKILNIWYLNVTSFHTFDNLLGPFHQHFRQKSTEDISPELQICLNVLGVGDNFVTSREKTALNLVSQYELASSDRNYTVQEVAHGFLQYEKIGLLSRKDRSLNVPWKDVEELFSRMTNYELAAFLESGPNYSIDRDKIGKCERDSAKKRTKNVISEYKNVVKAGKNVSVDLLTWSPLVAFCVNGDEIDILQQVPKKQNFNHPDLTWVQYGFSGEKVAFNVDELIHLFTNNHFKLSDSLDKTIKDYYFAGRSFFPNKIMENLLITLSKIRSCLSVKNSEGFMVYAVKVKKIKLLENIIRKILLLEEKKYQFGLKFTNKMTGAEKSYLSGWIKKYIPILKEQAKKETGNIHSVFVNSIDNFYDNGTEKDIAHFGDIKTLVNNELKDKNIYQFVYEEITIPESRVDDIIKDSPSLTSYERSNEISLSGKYNEIVSNHCFGYTVNVVMETLIFYESILGK